MMKHLLTIVLCLTTLTGLAQEEKIKKSEWWNGNPSYAVPIREVNVTARRPMKEIGIQKTQLDTTILHENIALSMADILTFNTSISSNSTAAPPFRPWRSAVRRPRIRR